ncbi:MAG: flavodoxin family protein [Syntrophobacterales bacterium]|jgi:multimeric flavodoxin WrbA|nr:flavodoxin family protein [Syntrophobacterales bacterium]
MNILALNSSPRDHETSKTELVLQKFLEGARRAGATAETLYLRNYKINHCLGCYDCWLKTPGRCIQKDDMSEVLFDRYLAADLVVVASPIYNATMNARMKLFVERTLPLMDPLKEPAEAGGVPHRFEKMPKVVTLSVCGFWDPAMFQALSLTWRMCLGKDLVAEIYRHSSEFLSIPEFQPQAQVILDAVAQAGEEVVLQGQVSPGTMATLSQDLAPADTLARLLREFWSQGVGA